MNLSASTSGRAETDLTNQYWWYMDNASPEVAERFLTAFDSTLKRLLKMPGIGRRRRFRSPELQGIRSMTIGGGFGSHLIFFQVCGEVLSVERVMHGARDLEKRLVEPPENYPSL